MGAPAADRLLQGPRTVSGTAFVHRIKIGVERKSSTLLFLRKHVLIIQVCVQPRQLGCQNDTAGIRCCALIAAIHRYILPAERSAANPPHAAPALGDGTDGRTGRRTDRQTTDGRSIVS